MNRIVLSLFILLLTTFSSKAVTFQTYDELYGCVENYNNFLEYKQNLKKCFKKQNITIEKDSLELIKNDSGVIEDVIELDLPKETKIKKPKRKLSEIVEDLFQPADLEKMAEEESIFNKPSALSDEYREKTFSLNDKDFKDLNNHIKANPENIYSLTEDINILTYKNNYLSEFKRQEILLNIYNTFDVAILASKVPPSNPTASFGGSLGAAGGVVAVGFAAAAGGGGGGSGGSSSGAATLSFAVSSSSVGECDSNVTISANLTKAHSSNVTVTYTVGGTATLNTDYTLTATTSTITAGATSGSITLDPTNDTTVETSETVTLAASVTAGGVSTTGNTSTTITIYDYVLKCNSTAFTDQGTSSTKAARDEFENVEGSSAATKIHPFELLNIHKAHAFNDGTNDLDGTGIKIHVADFNCDKDHAEFTDAGFSGSTKVEQYLSMSADSSSSYHCNLVAGIAAGNFDNTTGTLSSSGGAGIMGVAYNAGLVLTSVPDVTSSETYSNQHKANAVDYARARGATVSNNSWGSYKDDCYSYYRTPSSWAACNDANSGINVTELNSFISSNSSNTNDENIAARLSFSSINTTNGAITSTVNSGNTTAWQNYITALNDFQTAGGVHIFATGNSTSESDVSAFAGLPTWYSQLAEAWLAVGWVDVTGVSARSSITTSHVTQLGNVCGSAAAYCLVADSKDIGSAKHHDSGTSNYQNLSGGGSSSASPMVSGIVALLQQAFPNHTGEQVVDRLLASAKNDWFTPTGATTFTTHGASIKHGYHSTWGHGFPDAYAALSPITSSANPGSFGFASPPGGGGSGGGGSGGGGSGGGGSVPFSQVNKLAVSETTMKISSSLGDAIMNGLKGKTAYAYDALNGGFKMNVTDFINYDNLTEQKIEYSLESEIDNLRNFKFSDNKTAKDFNIYAGEYLSFRDKYNRGLSFTLDQPNLALQNFNLYNNQNYKNPFTSENKGMGFNNKFYFMGNNVLLGYNNSKINPLTNINKDIVVPLETVALSFNLDNDNFDLLSFTTGLLKEENTFLLSEGSGAFDLNDEDNLSNFYGFNLSKSLNNLGNIYFSTMFGNSKLDNAKNSLIVDTSNVLSSSFEINYELKNLFKNDQFNISLSQPNRVEQGDMTFRFVGLADKNGVLPYQDYKVSLAPTGRQKDLTFNYITNHSDHLKTGIKAIITDDLGHIKNNNLDTNLLLSATFNF